MKKTFKILATGLILTSALAACSQPASESNAEETAVDQSAATPAATATPASGENPPTPTREPALLEEKLEGIQTTDGKNVDSVMYIASFPPGSVSAKHSHPGWEYNYILEGSITFDVEGQEPFTLKAGEGTYNKRGNVHTVKNGSATEPARLVSVLVKDEGAPVAVNVE